MLSGARHYLEFYFCPAGPGLRVPGIFLWTSMGLNCDAGERCAHCPIWHIIGKPKTREARCNGFVDTKRVLVPCKQVISFKTLLCCCIYMVRMGKQLNMCLWIFLSTELSSSRPNTNFLGWPWYLCSTRRWENSKHCLGWYVRATWPYRQERIKEHHGTH